MGYFSSLEENLGKHRVARPTSFPGICPCLWACTGLSADWQVCGQRQQMALARDVWSAVSEDKGGREDGTGGSRSRGGLIPNGDLTTQLGKMGPSRKFSLGLSRNQQHPGQIWVKLPQWLKSDSAMSCDLQVPISGLSIGNPRLLHPSFLEGFIRPCSHTISPNSWPYWLETCFKNKKEKETEVHSQHSFCA